MKKAIFTVAVILIFAISCTQAPKIDQVQKNKEISARYHELKAENIDTLLTANFMGRTAKDLHTWNREDHRGYLTGNSYKKDSVIQQVAEGDWVATRFVRTMDYKGDTVNVEGMQFKRFEKGKIAEIWEYWDYQQIKELEDKSAMPAQDK